MVQNIATRWDLYKQYYCETWALICEKLHPMPKAKVESLQSGNQMIEPVCSTLSEDKRIERLRSSYPDKSAAGGRGHALAGLRHPNPV